MAAHLKLCNASKEMNATSGCQSFHPLGEEAMLASIQNVEFGGCERTAVSIALEKRIRWTMAAHQAV